MQRFTHLFCRRHRALSASWTSSKTSSVPPYLSAAFRNSRSLVSGPWTSPEILVCKRSATVPSKTCQLARFNAEAVISCFYQVTNFRFFSFNALCVLDNERVVGIKLTFELWLPHTSGADDFKKFSSLRSWISSKAFKKALKSSKKLNIFKAHVINCSF